MSKEVWIVYRTSPPSEFANAILAVLAGNEARKQVIQIFSTLKEMYEDGNYKIDYTEDGQLPGPKGLGLKP